MAITQVITPLPPAPQRTDPPAVFVPRADAHVASLAQLVTEENLFGEQVNTTQVEMDAAASSAAVSAAAAASSEAIASGASNFIGKWATKPDGSPRTGAISVPSSSEHEGAVYLLLNDLAEVELSEPGVTADWLNITGGLYVTPVAGAELSTVLVNRIKTSDVFKYPVAATVRSGVSVKIAILEVDKGVTPQIDLQGGDGAKNGISTVTDSVVYSANFSGVDIAVSDGAGTWEF